MKRFSLLLILTLTVACTSLQPAPTVTSTPPPSETPTVTPLPTATYTPEPTATPTYIPPEPITCTDDTCLRACLKRITEVLGERTFDPVSEAFEDNEKLYKMVTYRVEGEEITHPSEGFVPKDYQGYQKDTAAHLRIWNYFRAILPPEQRVWISSFQIFSDGDENILAYVRPLPNSDKWILAADILDSTDPLYMTETLIHEFGHLLTLNADQVPQSDDFVFTGEQNTAACPSTFASWQGCSNPDSYMNQFYQRYWKTIYKEWFENVALPSGGRLNFNLVGNFYERYRDRFVSPYAASQPVEDITETFSFFVLNPKPRGDSIADQKILFFYEYPELVSLRQYTIQGMCTYAGE